MRLFSIFQFLLVICSFIYVTREAAVYMCKSNLEEIGFWTMLMRKLFAMLESSYKPVPTACLLQETLDLPLNILLRLLFLYSSTILATLCASLYQWVIARASKECQCLP